LLLKPGLAAAACFPHSMGFLWLGCLHASFPHVPRSLEHQSSVVKGNDLGKSNQLDAKAAKDVP